MKIKRLIVTSLVLVMVLMMMSNTTTTIAQDSSVNFHEDIKEGESWKWKVKTLRSSTGDTSGEPVQEGDTIEIEVIRDPSTASYSTYYTEIFKTTINGDSTEDDGSIAADFIFPISFTLYGVEFNTFEEFTKDGDEYVIAETSSGCTTEFRYQDNGLMNLWEYSCEGDELLIERNTGLFSFLPVPIFWMFLPVLAIPIIRVKRRNN